MNIIFDYNRTLFDPENKELYPGVLSILENLSKKHELFLLCQNEFGRQDFIKSLKIEEFFNKILLVDQKSKENMSELLKSADKSLKTLVIGDRIKKEIRIGNEMGHTTVWLQRGKFAVEIPEQENEQPNHIINSINEAVDIIKIYE